MVGRSPWTAADALVGLTVTQALDSWSEERVRGDPRGPGGPPHQFGSIPALGLKWHWAVSPANLNAPADSRKPRCPWPPSFPRRAFAGSRDPGTTRCSGIARCRTEYRDRKSG